MTFLLMAIEKAAWPGVVTSAEMNALVKCKYNRNLEGHYRCYIHTLEGYQQMRRWSSYCPPFLPTSPWYVEGVVTHLSLQATQYR